MNNNSMLANDHKKEAEFTLFTVRIQNGQRMITVLLESEEQPDMFTLYRTFCTSTPTVNSDRLHVDFANWLEDLGWERCKAITFNTYDPELVRKREQ